MNNVTTQEAIESKKKTPVTAIAEVLEVSAERALKMWNYISKVFVQYESEKNLETISASDIVECFKRSMDYAHTDPEERLLWVMAGFMMAHIKTTNQ